MSYTPFIIIGIWLGITTLMLGQGKFIKYFNLADKRSFVGGESSYQKLNKLMSVGDVSLYRSEFSSEPTVSIRATYSISKTETSEISIRAKSFDKAVELSYQTALSKGFIKE